MYLSSQKKLKRKKSVGQITAPSSRGGLRTIADTCCLSSKKILDCFYLSTTADCGDLSDGVTQALIPEVRGSRHHAFLMPKLLTCPFIITIDHRNRKKALRCIYYLDIMRSYRCPHLVKALLLPPDNQGPGSW